MKIENTVEYKENRLIGPRQNSLRARQKEKRNKQIKSRKKNG
jgi:hypothetical protein